MVTEQVGDVEVTQLTHGDLIKLHASRAGKALGLSTGDFLAKWEADELDGELARSNHPDVVRWAMLMSFGRQHSG